MQSFRTELENPVVEQEIIELERKIWEFQNGKLPEEKFRSLRLARGVYGQRQAGVQMVRIKLPFGKISFDQMLKIADVSDEYASKNLHLTTRQDIQIHYVSLDKTPEVWAKLAEDDMTLREACGNTVRNVTASATAGIDPEEPFDVSPYAHAVFEYFLRNPICADMGRKFKIAFSSSDKDTAFAYIHDFGFIPKIRIVNGEEKRGFKVLLGGGLGAQPMLAYEVNDFLAEEELIPYVEATLRVFERYGERTNRNKARFKYLLQKEGLEKVLQLIEAERIAVKNKVFYINTENLALPNIPENNILSVEPVDIEGFLTWKKTNTFRQKQKDFLGVFVGIPTGDIPTDKARKLAKGLRGYISDDIRITQGQNLLFKFVREEALPHVYNILHDLGYAKAGHDSTADVTTCPGTDTCNLGISNSTEMARILEDYIQEFHADFLFETNLKIKISGCMNSCGQHGLAHIGFHGSSSKVNGRVIPAAQVMLGGGTVGNGIGRVAERITKVPTKRVIQVVDVLLLDFKKNKNESEDFHAYYDRQTKDYFYQLLKPIADTTNLTEDEYLDWGHEETFATAIGVGECASVIIDLVATLLIEAEEKFDWARKALEKGQFADAIYHIYSSFVCAAKALLLDKGVSPRTQSAVIEEFDKHYVSEGIFTFPTSFAEQVLQINKFEPSKEFAETYLLQATAFQIKALEKREAIRLTNN